MKILKIHFKNIHSLEGEHEIDFTQKPFAQSHLFAITGATGSGKSTILDVIPLALYNKIPRLESAISKNLMLKNGAILTRGQREAFARVTYACKKGIFTTEWHVRVADNGNLQDHEMFLYDAEGKPITQKKSEVPAKNEELIGLNYEQFIKSVMLAQGEFSRFLKVKKEERSALLEQITGTAIYRRLGQAAYEKFKGLKNLMEESEHRVTDLKTKLLTPAEIQKIQTQEKELKEIQKSLTNELKELESNLEAFSQWKIQKNQITELTKREEKAQQNLENFHLTEGEKLIWHEKTNAFGDELFDWNAKKKDLQGYQSEIDLKTKEKISAEKRVHETIYAVQNWVKIPNLESEEIDFALSDFYQKIKKWEDERNKKLSLYKELKAAVSAELRVLNLSFESTKSTHLKQKWSEIEQFFKPLKIQEISKKDFLAQKERLQEAIEKIQSVEKKALEIIQFEQNNTEKKDKLRRWNEEKLDLSPRLRELKNFLSLQKLNVEKLELEIQNRELQKTLADYRADLEENKPCPLCGSVHHPWANKAVEKTDELHKKFKEEKKLLENRQEEKFKLETDFSSLEKNITALEKEVLENERELQLLIQIFRKESAEFHWNSDFSTLISEKKKALKNWENYYENLMEKKALETVLPLYERLDKITQEGLDLKKKIDEATHGADLYETTQFLQKKWQEAKSNLRNAEQNLEDLNAIRDEKEKIFQGLEKKLENQVSRLGFDSISSAFGKRLDAEVVKSLNERKSNIVQSFENLKLEKNLLKKSFDVLDSQLKNLDFEQSLLARKETAARLESNEVLLKEFFAQQRQQQIYEAEILLLNEKIAVENKKIRYWRMLNELIGDARGKRFNDFAQDLTLSQLLHLANKRLVQLKSRYWLTQPEANEDDGLMAIDQDMGNQRRSVKTLSGGETFILSLALALGLSDLAAHNVRIETLFIDEGFGTLDPEILDKTMDTLERLQQENQRMIGIISHVEMLKERISTQIQIKQNGNGMSDIEVVG